MKGESALRLSIQQETLAAGLGVVVRAVSSRSTLPVLSDVLLRAEADQTLLLAASNLELTILHRAACQVEAPGAIAVPARALADLVSTLPHGPLHFALKKTALELTCGPSRTTLNGVPASEFPPLPQVDGPGLSVPAGEFKALIQRTVFAASEDQSRPELTGALLVAEEHCLTLAAADGFRLSESKITLEQLVPQPLRCLVPARALSELARLAGEAETVEIVAPPGKGQIAFRLPGTVLVTQLIEGRFPDYHQIIPTRSPTRLTVPTAALLKACKQAEIFARENGKAARLALHDGQVEVHGHSDESGSTGATIEAVLEGPPLEIAFNVAFLREALSAIRTPSVSLEASIPNAPGVFKPVGEDGFIHVIMPLYQGG